MRKFTLYAAIVGAMTASAFGGYSLKGGVLNSPACFTPLKGDEVEVTRSYGHPIYGNVTIKLAPDVFEDFTSRDIRGFQAIDAAMHRYDFVRDEIAPDINQEPVKITTRQIKWRGQNFMTDVVEIGYSSRGMVAFGTQSARHDKAMVDAVLDGSKVINKRSKS